jgi:hypothetical protein
MFQDPDDDYKLIPPEPRDPLLGVKTALRMVQVVFALLMLSVIAMLSYLFK